VEKFDSLSDYELLKEDTALWV